MGLLDWIDDKVFDIHWYFTVERDVKKSMKQFSDTMDKAIATLNEAAAKIPDSDNGDKVKSEFSQPTELEKEQERAVDSIQIPIFLQR